MSATGSPQSTRSLETPITRLLGIRYPILQAGMSGISTPELVAAVSNAGGLGILSGALTPAADLRAKIDRIRQLTDRPFGVNLLLHEHLQPPRDPSAIPDQDIGKVQSILNGFRRRLGLTESNARPPRVPNFLDEEIALLLEIKVPVFSIGLGNPASDLVKRFHDRGSKVIAMVCTPNDARAVAQSGVDAIVVQGAEAGGHRSTWAKRRADEALIGLVPLIKAVAAGAHRPVIAAGGIMDGSGLIAALSMGAAGVLMGTRFIATAESGAPPSYKKAIVEKSGEDTVITDAFTGMYARVLRNTFTESFRKAGDPVLPPFSQFLAGGDVNAAALKKDEPEYYPLYAGQGAGQVKAILPAGEVVKAIVAEAEACLGRFNG